MLELLIFLGIFSAVLVALTAVFVSILRINVRQTGEAEVNRQSQLVLQTVQYYVERASQVNMAVDSPSATLTLRMPDSASDPVKIYLSGTALYLAKGQSPAEALTSSRVEVKNASFARRLNPPGRDIVDVNFTISYANPNAQSNFTQSLAAAVTRVSAASFDSDVVASTSNLYNLGVGAGNWRSINGTIYFNGSNVGIGLASPNSLLQIHGGDINIDTYTNGLILHSSNGTCFRVSITNGGALSTATTTCP